MPPNILRPCRTSPKNPNVSDFDALPHEGDWSGKAVASEEGPHRAKSGQGALAEKRTFIEQAIAEQ